MQTNRKTRPQPSLASLTADEYHQLAEMVCTRTYEDVRQQVNKPRAEGGFDLNISIKPLQVLHARVQRLNKINEQLATGENLTLTAYDEIHAGEKRAPEEVHDAIMSATYILVTEQDNTPHQLLALQRLADFPARAEIHEQMATIRAERLEIARSKEKRAQEMHTHKIALDLRKQTHKEKTAAFQQHLALSRLNLTLNRNPNLFSSEYKTNDDAMDYNDAQVGSVSPSGPSSRDAITDHDAASADQNAPIEDSKNSSSVSSVPPSSVPSVSRPHSFLSPEVIANTDLYDQKIDAGEIRVIYAAGKHYEIEYCNPADQPALERMHKSAPLRFFEDPTRTQWLPALRTFGKNPYIPPTAIPLNTDSPITEHSPSVSS